MGRWYGMGRNEVGELTFEELDGYLKKAADLPIR